MLAAADPEDLDDPLLQLCERLHADGLGEIVVYWELPSFVAFAEAETALHEDAEFLAMTLFSTDPVE